MWPQIGKPIVLESSNYSMICRVHRKCYLECLQNFKPTCLGYIKINDLAGNGHDQIAEQFKQFRSAICLTWKTLIFIYAETISCLFFLEIRIRITHS